MFLPAWAIRFAPYVGGLLLILGVYVWGNSNGRNTEREKWQAARAELLTLRAERVQHAAEKLAQKSAAAPQVATKEIVRVETRWIDRPVRECFDDELVRSLEEARAAVRRSAAPSASND